MTNSDQTEPARHSDEPDDAAQLAEPTPTITTQESGGAAVDEDLSLRTDVGEWQEAPSPEPNPGDPEPVAERMDGADDPAADEPGEAGTGAAKTADGQIVRETDFYPSGLPGHKSDSA